MEQQTESTARGSLLSLMLALFFGGGFLVFLILISGGIFLYVFLAAGAIGLLGILHYALWGERMMEEVAAERAFEEAKARREAERAMDEHPYGIREL